MIDDQLRASQSAGRLAGLLVGKTEIRQVEIKALVLVTHDVRSAANISSLGYLGYVSVNPPSYQEHQFLGQ